MQLISSKRVLRQIFWLNFISFREKLSVAKNLARKVTLVSKWGFAGPSGFRVSHRGKEERLLRSRLPESFNILLIKQIGRVR